MRAINLYLSIERMDTQDILGNINEYISDTHSLSRKEKKKLEDYLTKLTHEDEREDYIQSFEDVYSRYSTTYPVIINHSMMVSIYSVLESKVKALADLVDMNFIKANPKKLKDKNLDTYFTNLVEWSGIITQDNKDLYNTMYIYRKLRNLIVHNTANIYEPNQTADLAVHSTCKDDTTFKLNTKTGELSIINDTFISNFSQLTEKFILSLIQDLKQVTDNKLIP